MKKVFLGLITLICISFGGDVKAQSKGSASDLSFIRGSWKADFEGIEIEGVWLAPKENNMLGFMRWMKEGKATMYEILAYEQQEKGFVSSVKHFQPGLIGQEEKDKQDRYVFVEASKDRAIFQKESDGMRILYEKRSRKQFVIARGSQENGKWSFKDLFVFNRVK